MARYRRIYSETGVYHVMCRGKRLIIELRQKSDLSIRDIGKLLKIGRNIVANTK